MLLCFEHVHTHKLLLIFLTIIIYSLSLGLKLIKLWPFYNITITHNWSVDPCMHQTDVQLVAVHAFNESGRTICSEPMEPSHSQGKQVLQQITSGGQKISDLFHSQVMIFSFPSM